MGFWKKLFGGNEMPEQDSDNANPIKKQMEDFYEVKIDEKSITVSHPKRPLEEIDWNEIEEIKLINTDEGPFLPDVWLILLGNGKGCSIPQGSEGWDKVYDIVSKYKNFNFGNVIKSAQCAENQTFELWKK